MACSACWASPFQPGEKHSYLVHLSDVETGRWGRCVVQSECSHDMQEWADAVAEQAMLYVHDDTGEKFLMLHPRVMYVDADKVAHVPVVENSNPPDHPVAR